MPALNKYSLIGFGLQTAEAEATLPTFTWLPLAGSLGFKKELNPEVLDMADRNHFDHLSFSKGQWWAGSIPIYLCSGAVTNLIDWIQTRDTNNQGKFANIWITQGVTGDATEALTGIWRRAVDVKVNSAEFAFTAGDPVRVNLNCTGKGDGAVTVAPTGHATVLSAIQGNPFLWKEATLSIAATEAANVAVDYTIKDLTVTIDNAVQDPSDGLRFNGSYNPYRLYNTGGVKVSGSFTRDMSDRALYDAYHNQYTAAAWYSSAYNIKLQIVIAAVGLTGLTLSMPSVRITEYEAQPSGERRSLITESVSFEAFGSVDGATAPITLS